ncbi:MAG: hypothetical protein AABY22_36100 [Nanoarchaeota archaeon]
MSLECEVGFAGVFNPEEFIQREIEIEKDLSWFEYWIYKFMPVSNKEINRTYEKIMSLWDVSMEDAQGYLYNLNRISSSLIDIHHRTLHY